MTGNDTELLELCAAWRQAVDRFIPILDRHSAIHEDYQSAADRALYKKAGDEVSRLEDRVFDTKATTLAGLKAKAEVLDHLDTLTDGPASPPGYGTSLAADILALGATW